MRMLGWNAVFETKKPLIGQITLPALPATMLYEGSLHVKQQQALEQQVLAFSSSGVDGLLFCLEPEVQGQLSALSVEAVVTLTLWLKRFATLTALPLGLNHGWADLPVALSLAQAGLLDWLYLQVGLGARLTQLGWQQAQCDYQLLSQHAKLPVFVALSPHITVPTCAEKNNRQVAEMARILLPEWLLAQSCVLQQQQWISGLVVNCDDIETIDAQQILWQHGPETIEALNFCYSNPASLEVAETIYHAPHCQGLFLGSALSKEKQQPFSSTAINPVLAERWVRQLRGKQRPDNKLLSGEALAQLNAPGSAS